MAKNLADYNNENIETMEYQMLFIIMDEQFELTTSSGCDNMTDI